MNGGPSLRYLMIEAEMTTFSAGRYWPQPPHGVTLVNTYSDGIVNTYTSAADGSVRLRQVINGRWDCDWYYRRDPLRGVIEYLDCYPKRWFNRFQFWKQTREVWCVPGKEIFWGGHETIGTSIGRQCVTSGLLGQYGWQELSFNAILPVFKTPAGTFHNVLSMEYWQSWGNTAPIGAKMILAAGVGQIHAEWTANRVATSYSMMLQETKATWHPALKMAA
jgi:hypothetical protein